MYVDIELHEYRIRLARSQVPIPLDLKPPYSGEGFAGSVTLEIDYTDFPCGFERLVALIQIRSVHKAGGSVLECSSTPMDMAEQVNPRLLLFNRIK
jgi:hypothetical protein